MGVGTFPQGMSGWVNAMRDKRTSTAESGRSSTLPAPSSPRAIAHDLRQPLAAIGALVTSAEHQPDVPATTRRCLHQIRAQVEELNRLCLRIVESKESPRTRVAVHELAVVGAETVSLATGRRVTVSAGNGFVRGDGVSLRRALLNLLQNACRATEPEGEVCVRVTATRREVRLEVHDDGPGFGTVAPGSASLGLMIADAVAAEHGGYLEIAESDLGGAAVMLVLPSWSAVARRSDAGTEPVVAKVAWSDSGDGQCVS